MRTLSLLTILTFCAATAGAAHADDHAKRDEPIKVGDSAPDVTLFPAGSDEAKTLVKEYAKDKDPEDTPVTLSMFEGEKNVVLAFYPKAFTGGCTKQLCGYRDDISTFKDADTVVIAVSNDAQEDSSAFREEYEMPFPVAGDKNENVLNAFGIPRIEFNGQEFAKRTIVVVDKKGVVRYTDMDYVIGQDEEPLYASLEKLEEETEGS